MKMKFINIDELIILISIKMSVLRDNFIRYEVTVTRGCRLCFSLHHLFIFSTFENVFIYHWLIKPPYFEITVMCMSQYPHPVIINK